MMKNVEVKIGGVYLATVGGRRTRVRIDRKSPELFRGWDATNLSTGRRVQVKSGRRLSPLTEEKILNVGGLQIGVSLPND